MTESSRPSRRRDMLIVVLPVGGILALLLVFLISERRATFETVQWINDRGGEALMAHAPLLPMDLAGDVLWLPEVFRVDLSGVPTTDEHLERLAEIPTLRALSVRGPELTDAGLLVLEQMTELGELTLIDCPQVSEPALKRLQRVNPALEIQVRGPALLGIAGHAHAAGCQIVHVQPGSGADAAGLLAGDILTGIGSDQVTDFGQLVSRLKQFQPGDEVELTLLRPQGAETDPQKLTVRAVLGKW